MCGIVGIYNYLDKKPVDRSLLKKMTDILAHRGPDGEGFYFDDKNGLGFGHRRLAIIDLETGQQPMCNEDESIWIIANGEIYNYREIRDYLKAEGHIFKTKSDTEVVVHAYEEFGVDCPQRFNGIFAFAIWDARKRMLFLARDHFGVKPLYHFSDGNRFYFASEIKALLCDPAVPREVDLNGLNLCLTLRHTPSPWTLFKGIYKIRPGCFLTVTRQGIHEKQYRDDAVAVDRATDESDWIAQLRAVLEKTVVRQMVSDVPIGLSLSSGVDSTTILALMSKHNNGKVKAFTVGFSGREKTSEIAAARRMADRFGAEFHEKIITHKDYSDFMARYVWHLEEPVSNESASAYYFVADMARAQGVKVLLNGQGADEAYAGYGRYVGIAHRRLLGIMATPPLRGLMPLILRGSLLGERYHRLVSVAKCKSEGERFLHVYSILTREMRKALILPEISVLMEARGPIDYVEEQLARAPKGTALERMIHVDTRTSLPDNLLLCEDKMAMAAGVEARVPYLDVDLMAIAERIPGRLKLRGLRDKYIHRRASADWVGSAAAARPQIGFDNAMDIWLRAQLGDFIGRFVESKDSFMHAYLDSRCVSSLLEEHARRQRDHQRILFLLLSLEYWYKVFFQNG